MRVATLAIPYAWKRGNMVEKPKVNQIPKTPPDMTPGQEARRRQMANRLGVDDVEERPGAPKVDLKQRREDTWRQRIREQATAMLWVFDPTVAAVSSKLPYDELLGVLRDAIDAELDEVSNGPDEAA